MDTPRYGSRPGSRSRRGNRHRLRPGLLELEERRLLAIAVTSRPIASMWPAPFGRPSMRQIRPVVPTSIVFELGTSAATITLTQGELDLTNPRAPVTIYDGPGQGDVTVSGNNNGRVFKIDKGVTANISDLAITKGLASGFSTSSGSGGELYNLGTVNLMDCTISGNVAKYQGGGLYNYGTANLTDCFVGYNKVTGPDNGKGDGAGLFNGSEYVAGSLTLTNCSVYSNKAEDRGGALYDRNGTATLNNCTISGNTAGSAGGGHFSYAKLNLSGCTISGNYAYDGGGLYQETAYAANLVDCTIAGNSAGDNGGGLANPNGTAILTACTVTGNSAFRSGGLANGPIATMNLTDTIVAGNTFTSSPQAPGPSEASVLNRRRTSRAART